MKIIECTHCGMKYRLDPAKFKQSQLRIRCKSCENTFEADLASAPDASAPAAPVPAKPPAAPAAPAAAPQPSAAQDAAAPAAAPSTAAIRGDGQLVLVAHDDGSVRAGMVTALGEAGYSVIEADNGVEALAIIQRQRPRVAVLDVTLPKVFGFEICEIVRRDPELADVRLILIAAIYDQHRYKRPPQQLYGADDYIEKQDISTGLVAKVGALAAGESAPVGGFGGGAIPGSAPASAPASRPAAATPEPAPASAAPTAAEAAPGTAVPTAAELGLNDDEFKRMRRLARTIVSDIVLYNQDKVETGVRTGDLAGALADELAEGRQLFAERLGQLAVDPSPFMDEYLGEIEVGKRQEYGLDG